jgi:hypothetical protein
MVKNIHLDVIALTRFMCCITVLGRFLNLSSLIGESLNVDAMRWMPCSFDILESKSGRLISLLGSSLRSSPKVGRTSIDVLPRSDLTSNLATVTPSLSVADANTSPMKRDDAIPFFKTFISGGTMALDGDTTPLETPPL